MVRVLIDQLINARVRVDGMRADEVRAGDAVPEMTVDRVDEKELAVLVPVVSPWIGRAGAERLHNLAPRMITPKGTAERDALLCRSAWRAHLG